MAKTGRAGATVARNALIYAAIVGLALLLWQLKALLLIIFGGVLVAAVISAPVDWLVDRTSWDRRVAYAVTVPCLILALALFGVFFGYRISGQFQELASTLPSAVTDLVNQLPTWLRDRLEQFGQANGNGGSGILGQLAGAAGFVLGAVADFVLIIFLALFLAVDPRRYRDGLVMLIPRNHQSQVREALNHSGSNLRSWLLGQGLSMIAVGILTTLGLLIMGVPMAFALGVIAALFEFVPVVGPIASAIPAVLVAFTLGPAQAMWVALIYLGIQQIEANILQPLVQKWAVSMPPAVALVSGVAFVLVFGIKGVIFAVPFTVVLMTLIGHLYIQDALDQEYHGPDGHSS